MIHDVPSSGYAELLVNSGDGPTMVINRDLVTQLFVGNDNSVASKAGTGDVDIIDPLSYMTFPGDTPKWGVAAAGGPIVVDCVKGAVNWAPSPAQTAQQISLLGLAKDTSVNAPAYGPSTLSRQVIQESNIPFNMLNAQQGVTTEIANFLGGSPGAPGAALNHGTSNIVQHGFGAPITLAAGASTTVTAAFNRPGYQIRIQPFITSNDTLPLIQFSLQWFDLTVNAQIAEDDFYCYLPTSGAGPVHIYGEGPVKGSQLQLVIKNWCNTQTASVVLTLDSVTHHIARDDWRSTTLTSVVDGAGSTPLPGDPFSNVLASAQGIAIAASGVDPGRLIPLYVGQAQLTVVATNVPASPITYTILGASNPNIPLNTVLWQTTSSAQFFSSLAPVLPRFPCRLGIANGSNANTFAVAISAQEFAS